MILINPFYDKHRRTVDDLSIWTFLQFILRATLSREFPCGSLQVLKITNWRVDKDRAFLKNARCLQFVVFPTLFTCIYSNGQETIPPSSLRHSFM